MRPDQRWFPTNRTERAAWFKNFTTQFAGIAFDLQFTQADIDALNADNAVIQFIATTIYQAEAYMRGLQAFQQIVTLGKNNNAIPNFPAFPVLNVPTITSAGIFERLDRLVRRIRAAPGYSPKVGAVLGIIPRTPSRVELTDTVPVIKTSAAVSGYKLVVRVTRGIFDGFRIEIRRHLSNAWEPMGLYARSPAEVAIVPKQSGGPEMIDVRIRMVKGNDPIGQYSDIQTVTLIP